MSNATTARATRTTKTTTTAVAAAAVDKVVQDNLIQLYCQSEYLAHLVASINVLPLFVNYTYCTFKLWILICAQPIRFQWNQSNALWMCESAASEGKFFSFHLSFHVKRSDFCSVHFLFLWFEGTLAIRHFGNLAFWRFGHSDLWPFNALAIWRFGHFALGQLLSS